MKSTLAQVRTYERSVQLLMVNQFTINLGFYMLMPYLAAHLAGTLGLAGWLVGLILGVRNFSQQGMFLIGGTLADRFGYKPLIVAGCVLRIVGFATLGLVDSVPALLAASAATGLAGALFNPASRPTWPRTRASAEWRRSPCSTSSTRPASCSARWSAWCSPASTSASPAWPRPASSPYSAWCRSARCPPAVPRRRRPKGAGSGRACRRSGASILANRPFLLFSLAMIGSYVMSFQVYLALPLEVRRVGGEGEFGTAAVAVLFAVSGLSTIVGQTRVTAWCKARMEPGRALAWGLFTMGVAFMPLMSATACPSRTAGSGCGCWQRCHLPSPPCCCPWARWSPTPSRWTPSSASPVTVSWPPTTACTTRSAEWASPSGTC